MKKLMYFAAALLVLVGCNNKKNVIENAPQNLVTITGGIDFSAQDGPNKVVAKDGWESVEDQGDVKFIWEEGDEIAVVSEDYKEVKKFTVSEISQDGTTATFTGEPLSGGMEDFYHVYYPYEWGVATTISEEAEANVFANQQYTGKLRPIGRETYASGNSFSLHLCDVIDLSLTGSVKLGKITYHMEEGEESTPYDVTLSLGEGLQLANQPQHVTFVPFIAAGTGDFKLSFYDIENQLIMEKAGSLRNNWNEGELFSFPTLEVKAATPTVDPKDVFKENAMLYFRVSISGSENYDFTYKFTGSDFALISIMINGEDRTSVFSESCSVKKTGDYAFKFTLDSGIMYYDAENKTYKREGLLTNFPITEFKVNDVSIFDQLTDITE